MKIAIITDTWNAVNGVVTTLTATVNELQARGHIVLVIEPSMFKSISFSKYPEIKFSWNIWKISKILKEFKPNAIHISTEGPLGLAARWYCNIFKLPHNTSYHTKFPEYLKMYFNIPSSVGYFFMKLFHKYSHRVLVTTNTMKTELIEKGFDRLVIWNRGVDRTIFNSSSRKANVASKPVLVCVSRASIEKGVDDFCKIKTTGTKIFVGDGPYLNELKSKYPDVIFTGYKRGCNLAHYYANADVVVFPSKTDTFGVVMLESIACGTPVAAYPVTGPIDIIESNINGYLDNDINLAISKCLLIDRAIVEDSSKKYTWNSCTDIFEQNLIEIHSN